METETIIKFVKHDGGRALAGFKGHTGDCVARAIAIASGKPYKEVYDALAAGNAAQRASKRSSRAKSKFKVATAAHGINTTRKWFKDYMKSIGFEWTATMEIGVGTKVHLRGDELPEGRLVVALSRHYAAVIDGVLHDLSDCSRGGTRCVYSYWKYVGVKEESKVYDPKTPWRLVEQRAYIFVVNRDDERVLYLDDRPENRDIANHIIQSVNKTSI